MALGIEYSELRSRLHPDGSTYDATGRHVDPWTEKPLRAISEAEVEMFNGDLQAIASQYTAEPFRALLEKYQMQTLTLGRNVMEKANQPYGGANALGSEITQRLIRPIDVGVSDTYDLVTPVYVWDMDLSAEAVGDVWGFQTGGTTPADDTMGEEEGNIIVAFIDPVPRPGFLAYQVITGGNRTYPYYTMDWGLARADGIPIVECMAPIVEWPEDTVRINMIVNYRTNPDRIQSFGIHFARARVLVAAAGTA